MGCLGIAVNQKTSKKALIVGVLSLLSAGYFIRLVFVTERNADLQQEYNQQMHAKDARAPGHT